jgi:flagellar biogenesis protein FliO
VKKLALILFAITSFSIHATEVSIKGFDLKSDRPNDFRLSIKLEGNLNDNPQVIIDGKTLQVIIPNSRVNSKIQKKFSDTLVTAFQADRSSVNIKVSLPFSLLGKESLVNTTLKDGFIEVSFPKINVVTSKVSRSPSVDSGKAAKAIEENNAEAEKLDESYLTTLVKENEKKALESHKLDTLPDANKAFDRVVLTQSSVKKEAKHPVFNKEESPKSSFSLSTYIGKFIAFLSLMVLSFYGVLTLFKKGVIKKGKLGFLHSTKLVEVISTTHVAPKRSLMVVKAHKQVFLISNTESGMQLISEINDVAGLLKSGEEDVTGSNFDTNLYKANRTEKEFKLKEDAVGSGYSLDDMLNDDDNDGVGVDKTETHALNAIKKIPVKDQVKFSDQIKTKLKHMKQMQ